MKEAHKISSQHRKTKQGQEMRENKLAAPSEKLSEERSQGSKMGGGVDPGYLCPPTGMAVSSSELVTQTNDI
jgi:hypothetical protein